ncbi:UV-B-induced protein At3g17800, chloroplastic-like [Diospyros lotus]|uniref:UV-B-induced protein At3g17800, chloroplastic-like n=1 Tax=Diospyros lotus TaxID=55363 RepID=UPI0022504C31|nr:UV-B-induced protein At3g17800, chloroplastic-like [Diospyros lotus]
MDCCLSFARPSALAPALCFSGAGRRFSRLARFGRRSHRRPSVAASGREGFSSLNTPLEPKSPVGKFLSRVLQDDLGFFHAAVGLQLGQLAAYRDEAVARMNLSSDSDEACLHRRISELRERESQTAVEDVMYMLVLYKFNEIGVHLVPRLSRCIYNGRLEIWPSRDWELQSVHSAEVLEMIREHLTAVIGWRADANVTVNWSLTQISRLHLNQVYTASLLYGYFLKSASLRHHLEQSLAKSGCGLGISFSTPLPLFPLWPSGVKNTVFDYTSSTGLMLMKQAPSQGRAREQLRCYVTGFDPETMEMCAKPKTKEAVNLIEKHCSGLFGDERTGLIETNEVIVTSMLSLKRMVLEAVALGSFLWDAEEYIATVYKLNEN